MKSFAIKSLVAALALAGVCAAQAAQFQLVDFLGAGGYSASNGAGSYADDALDLSGPGSVALSGAQFNTSAFAGGSLEHGYAADGFLNLVNGGANLAMSITQSLSANASSGALNVASHNQGAFIDLTSVTLRIVGDAGEALGSPVQVSFAGVADALFSQATGLGGSYLGLGLSVLSGGNVLGDYLWAPDADGSQNVNFSFLANVGQEITLSGFMLTGTELTAASFAQAGSPYSLVESGAFLSGDFTISAVPEPESYLMLLTGLGLLGFAVRRRSR